MVGLMQTAILSSQPFVHCCLGMFLQALVGVLGGNTLTWSTISLFSKPCL